MDRWIICGRGHIHWGAHGGAGLFLRYTAEGKSPIYLLEQRSRWVDEGGTWGIPGGAIREGESPEAAAEREAEEEISPVPTYRVTNLDVQDCGGGWTFHIVRGDVDEPLPANIRHQTDATGWFTAEEMGALPLHPGFRVWFDQHRLEL